jgi:hypothetical protein
MPSSPADPQAQLLAAIISFVQSRAIAAAADLGLADLLAGGPLHIDLLAKLAHTHPRSLFRLMRALESQGIFTQVSPSVFGNTPVSDCLRSNVPGSLRSVIRAALSPGNGEYDAWAGFAHSLRTGKPAFDHIYGFDFWEFLKRNPGQRTIANESQEAYTALFVSAVVDGYDWERFSVIADIGGGTGWLLAAILAGHPSCRGILFDLPEVLYEALPNATMERVGGSFFESVPAGADAYLLRGVLHDWAEPEAVTILRNIRKAMRPDGRLVLVESVITDSSTAKWVDLQMLAVVGGEKRTAEEYGELFGRSGFDLGEIVPTTSPVSLLIGHPR